MHGQIQAGADVVIITGPLSVNLTRHRVFTVGELVHLKPLEYMLLEMLCLELDTYVTRTKLHDHLYSNRARKPKSDIIPVFVNGIRKKINAPKHTLIAAHWGLGWRLIKQPPHHVYAKAAG